MMVTRGKKHVFLGMEITYLDNGTAEIRMLDYMYVKESIGKFGENVNKSAASPAKRDLYENNNKKCKTQQHQERNLPQRRGKTPICIAPRKTGHAVAYRVLVHKSFMQHRTRLDKIETRAGVLEWHTTRRTGHRSGRSEEDEDMGRCILRCAPGHEESYRRCDIIWDWCDNGQVLQTEAEHKELHRSGTSGCKQLLATCNMGKTVSRATRI
jgi:hypothetical protein